ncbi:MAG: Ppx/GppA phosphatase family protein [Microthrixaceae bacterium]
MVGPRHPAADATNTLDEPDPAEGSASTGETVAGKSAAAPDRPGGDLLGGSAEVLAGIDIGTNSVHMIVALVGGDGRFEVLTRHKEVVRLGESGDDRIRQLSDAAIDRGIAALRRCRTVVDTYGAPVLAVATSAVREAENARDFIDRALRDAGIDVEVVSGIEEARLIHLGVLQALPLFDTPMLLCDIGGGSTEVLVAHRTGIPAVRSFKLGAIRMTRRFFPDGVTARRSVERARAFARSVFVPFSQEIRGLRFDVAVGCSGTFETLLAMSHADSVDATTPRSFNGAVLDREALGAVMTSLLDAATPEARAQIPGIDPGRADIIVGGAIVLEQAMDAFGIDEMTFSEYALREGVLFDLNRRLHGGSTHHLSDLRRRSVEHLMEVCDDEPAHSLKVASLALELFDALAPAHGYDGVERELLEAGAMLANVGMFVSHSRHHQHSYYVIRNSELMSGFNDHEIELIAQIARYHRRGEPSLKHQPFGALHPDDRQRVRWLAAILRVAVGLDRSLAGAVEAVDAEQTNGPPQEPVRIRITPRDGADVALELFSARERSCLLVQVLGRPVEVETAPAPAEN